MNSVLHQIGNSPLIRFSGSVPNNNRIWVKLECENPFGSHYDRVYRDLFRSFRESGKLKPGATVLETTSGSAGVSFAGIGSKLGYKCLVAIPKGGEKAREIAIENAGGELIFTPAEAYVNGFPDFLKNFLVKNREICFLNHSMGPNASDNSVTLNALGEIGTEILAEVESLDFFIAAVGNGSSVLGPGQVLHPKTKIVTFESFQSATAHELLYPGSYFKRFGIKPGQLPRHQLPGTSFPGIDFPHIHNAFLRDRIVSRTLLVSDQKTDKQYRDITGNDIPRTLPRWDDVDFQPYGRTTRAGLAVALQLANEVADKDIAFIAYDKADRYDT